MNYSKSIQDFEKDLKEAKKKYDKLLKQMKKARSSFQYENLADEAELISEDISFLQMTITYLRKKKKLAEIDSSY
jgi:predicted  nucleic acid-binding Zn-ribbon protein